MAEQFLMKNEKTGKTKSTYIGYSWTMLCFNAFAPLFRGDFATFTGIGAVNILTYILSPNLIFWYFLAPLPGLVYALFWNKRYTKSLLEEGYEFAESEDKINHAKLLLDAPNKAGKIICIVICIFNILAAFAITDSFQRVDKLLGSSDEQYVPSVNKNEIENAEVAYLSPYGKLADVFNLMSDYTDLQREDMRKSIIGKYVYWTLPVYEVNKEDSTTYKITVLPDSNVGCDIYVTNPNDYEIEILKQVKTGNYISFKGYIQGIDITRCLIIKPAIIIGDVIVNAKQGNFVFSKCFDAENVQCLGGKLNGKDDCLAAGWNYNNFCEYLQKGHRYKILYYTGEDMPGGEEITCIGGIF